jgi:hypothetical protein
MPGGPPPPRDKVPEAVYSYTTAEGEVIADVVRFPQKQIRQGVPVGQGEWEWGLNGRELPLYHLPEVATHLREGRREPIYIAEGEKDVDALCDRGVTATCNPMGAGKWRPQHTETLVGARHVIVVADNDEPGLKHARHVADGLRPHVDRVEIVRAVEGKDVSDHFDAGHGLGELVPVEDDRSEPEPDSWTPRNLALLGDRPQIRPTLGGVGLVYPGKRHLFSGPQESAKTFAAYAAILGVVRDGHTAVLIDFEMGDYDARDRLRDMGATDEDLARIAYVAPETPPTVEQIQQLIDLNPALVVVDASAGAYNLSVLDDNKRADVEFFTAIWTRPFWARNITTIVIDHVVKNTDDQGKYAIGSERKVGGVDVHLGFKAVTELRRGRRGTYKITTHKDRPGWLPRPAAGELEITSDPLTHALSWTFDLAQDEGATQAEWRPTVLMERVSRYLEPTQERVSRNRIEKSVEGNVPYTRKAIDYLVQDGYVEETAGPGKTRLYRSVKPFREHDLVHTSSIDVGSDLVQPRPSTSSQGNTATTPNSPTSSHLVPTSSLDLESTSSMGALFPTGEAPIRDEVDMDVDEAEVERIAAKYGEQPASEEDGEPHLDPEERLARLFRETVVEDK